MTESNRILILLLSFYVCHIKAECSQLLHTLDNVASIAMAVRVRGTLETRDVEQDDVVTLDDVGDTIAVLRHLCECVCVCIGWGGSIIFT